MREKFDGLKVVIIGAGVTGLSAALRLNEFGIKNIALLEAQSEPGGRVRSVNFSNGTVDLGAQWLHGTKSELCKIAKDSGLLLEEKSFEGLGNYYCEDGRIVPPKLVLEVNDVVADLILNLESLSEENVPDSVEKFLSAKFEEYLNNCEDIENTEIKRNLFDWNIRFQVIDNACTDLCKLSSNAFGDYQFCGGEDYINFKKGFQSLIDVLVSMLPEGCLFTGCPVKTIRWKDSIDSTSDNMCEIVTENGDEFLCDHVIITCSVGYLKNNWSMFSPPLPVEYIKGFNCIGFDPINKVFLEYNDNWWGDSKGIQFVWNTEERKSAMKNSPEIWTCDLTGFDVLVGLPNVLVGWVGGEGAVLVEELSTEIIGAHCTKLFREITGNPKIPLPTNCISSSWFNNKYIKGGYSHIRVERDRNKSYLTTLLKPVNTKSNDLKHPSLLFAGEALHGSYYSTTHGAFESGKNQADKIIDYINNHSYY